MKSQEFATSNEYQCKRFVQVCLKQGSPLLATFCTLFLSLNFAPGNQWQVNIWRLVFCISVKNICLVFKLTSLLGSLEPRHSLHTSRALLVLFAHSTWKQIYVRTKGTSECTFRAWKYFQWALIERLREFIILEEGQSRDQRDSRFSRILENFFSFSLLDSRSRAVSISLSLLKKE